MASEKAVSPVRAALAAITAMILAISAVPAALAGQSFPAFVPFDPADGEFPEGVAVDKEGNVFVSFDAPRGEVRRYAPDGTESLLVDFGSAGVLGLAVDAMGNVYVARYGVTNGVYRVDPSGNAELVPGTDAIVFPNALTFDDRGNLYISETFSIDPPLTEYPGCDIGAGPFFGQGGIWWVPRGGQAELLLRHELLTGLCLPNPVTFPIGANGIAYRHGELFLANTEKALIVRMAVDGTGAVRAPLVLAAVPDVDPPHPFGPPALDGLALDVHGGIYVAVINQSRIVRISPDGAVVETIAGELDGLDFPASLAFGTGRGERQSLFVTNFAIGPPGGAGPGIVKLDVGAPGLPLP